MEGKKLINNLIMVILVLVPLIINPFSNDYFYYPKITIIYVISGLIALIWFKNKEESKIILKKEEKLIIIYIVLLIISTIFSTNIIISLYGNVKREEGLFAIMSYVFLFLVASRFYDFNKKHIIYLSISASIIAIYGILQYFGVDPIPRDINRINWVRHAFSTMGNPNFLGSYLVLILPMMSFMFLYTSKALYLLPTATIYLCLLCTLTRGAWLGALFSIILLFFLAIKYKYKVKNIIILTSVFVLITIIMNIVTNGSILGRFLTISNDFVMLIEQQSEYETAGSSRIFIWTRVIKLILNKPLLGYGLENLGTIFSENYMLDVLETFNTFIIFDKAHNEYLNIAVTTGIPSLLVYLTFVAAIIRKTIKYMSEDIILIPIFCSIVGYLVQGFFNISVVCVAYIYWILLGILLNRIKLNDGKHQNGGCYG